MVRLILILTLISNIAFADDSTIHLNTNDKAPNSGYLIPDDKAKDLYDAVLERDSYKTQLDLTITNNNLYKQENGILLNQNATLIQAQSKAETLNDLEKIGCFFLGVIVTGLSIKAAGSLRP